jgi:hypothetical protein
MLSGNPSSGSYAYFISDGTHISSYVEVGFWDSSISFFGNHQATIAHTHIIAHAIAHLTHQTT